MAQVTITLPQRRAIGKTSRKDLWWVQPLLTFLGLAAFVVYSTWAAFQGAHYAWGPYLSPMYSLLLLCPVLLAKISYRKQAVILVLLILVLPLTLWLLRGHGARERERADRQRGDPDGRARGPTVAREIGLIGGVEGLVVPLEFCEVTATLQDMGEVKAEFA